MVRPATRPTCRRTGVHLLWVNNDRYASLAAMFSDERASQRKLRTGLLYGYVVLSVLIPLVVAIATSGPTKMHDCSWAAISVGSLVSGTPEWRRVKLRLTLLIRVHELTQNCKCAIGFSGLNEW